MPRIIASAKNWIEGEAVRQLERASGLAGMAEAVGLPDLQPGGKGYPVGAAFAACDVLYPYLIGNDIGCGVGLWQTDMLRKKLKIDRLEKRLAVFNDERGATAGGETPFDGSLGTLGGGNHFAELQAVERVYEEQAFTALGLSRDALTLLVHSGSRGLGEMILRSHIDRFRDAGLVASSPEASAYLSRHDEALGWAKENRKRLAQFILQAAGAEGELLLDLPHNFISQETVADHTYWLHRKGAVSSLAAAVVIPGSRGSMTYLVRPVGDPARSLYSLPHGAGRKWQRSECRARLERKFTPDDLRRPPTGGRVLCPSKDLLYEEAPQAYKNIDIVIADLLEHGLVEVIAVFRPVLTIKDF